jgi:hypothetical protein
LIRAIHQKKNYVIRTRTARDTYNLIQYLIGTIMEATIKYIKTSSSSTLYDLL